MEIEIEIDNDIEPPTRVWNMNELNKKNTDLKWISELYLNILCPKHRAAVLSLLYWTLL